MTKVWPTLLVTLLVAGGLGVLVAARRQSSPLQATVQPQVPPKKPDPRVTEAKDPPRRKADYLGVIIADQTVDVAANLDGRLADVLVRIGDRVVRGAPVATLDLRTLESDLAVAKATVKAARADESKARLEIADAETKLARSTKLGALIPAADLEAATSERKMASTRLESARAGVAEAQARVAKLEVSRTDSSVRAPFTGVVAARYLDPGALVHAQSPIVRIISADAIRVRFAVPEDGARNLAPGKAIKAHVTALDLDLPGIVESVAPEIDPAARMIFAEARLTAPPGTAVPAAGMVARIAPLP